jgi:hypothetical protein
MAIRDKWRGPFESRAAFERFQDQSIDQLAEFAADPPPLTDAPEQLKEQLWRMGKFVPAAILGLGRYNPAVTELCVWENKPTYEEVRPGYVVGTGVGPTVLRGGPAYERMVTSWHEVNDLMHLHRFEIQSHGIGHEVEMVYATATDTNKVFLVGHSIINEVFEQFGSFVYIPDTTYVEDKEGVEWTDYHATDGSPFGGPHYLAKPFHGSGGRGTEQDIQTLAGEEAAAALQSHGEVGLYQQLLASGVRNLLIGLDLGPNTKHEG